MVKQAVINFSEANIPLERKSDDALIMMFQSGEKHVFRILVMRYEARIRNLIFSIFHEGGIVDDLAQDVLMKIYESLPRFRFESSFYTWIYRITINKSRDELRKRKVKRFFSLQDMSDSAERIPELFTPVSIHDVHLRELIEKALNTLPEKYRLPIILKDIDDLSYDEMAEIMECTVGTVKSRLSRGRAKLKDILSPLVEV